MDFKSVYLWDNVRKLTFIVMLLLVAAAKIVSWAMVATLTASLAAQVMKVVLKRQEPEIVDEDENEEPVSRSKVADYVGIVLTSLLISAVVISLR